MKRRGFTLVELLVVIVILTILIALLVPAVMQAVTTARTAATASEIRSLEAALADFRSVYTDYPPSRIVVAEDGDYSTSNLASIPNGEGTKLAPRTLTYLRKFWPRILLRTDGTKPTISHGWYDVNGDHVLNPPYVMYGHECLALFLGGVPEQGGDAVGVSGMSTDPTNPFTSPQQPPVGKQWPYSNKRTTPKYSGRVAVTTNSKVAFIDQYKTYYAYFSAYNGVGYDPDDVNIPETDTMTSTSNALLAISAHNSATPSGNTTRQDIISSPSPNPYTNDPPIPVTSAGIYNGLELRRRIYYNDNTFQIVAAGADKLYGIGGQYSTTGPKTLPFYPANSVLTGQTLPVDVRFNEIDNVTNFAPGGLR